MTNIDLRGSTQLADMVSAHPKECWRNACMALLYLPDGAYVEGWIVTDQGLILEHGWIEQGDQGDQIVEPTLVLSYDPATLARFAYFPAVRYAAADVERLLLEEQRQPPFVWQDGANGMKCAEYADANRQASIYAFALMEAANP